MRGKGRSVQERLAAGWRRQDADELDGVGHDESSPRNESGSVQTSMQSALTDPRRIVAAEMYRINNRRYIAVADAVGKIAVVDVESRKIHSVFLAPDGVVAFRQSPHYVAWVGATAAGAAEDKCFIAPRALARAAVGRECVRSAPRAGRPAIRFGQAGARKPYTHL